MLMEFPFYYGLHGMTILMAAALLPPVLLMVYIYTKDQMDKEPPKMIIKMLVAGLWAALASIALEYAGENIIVNAMDIQSETTFYATVALMVGLAEEGSKLFFGSRKTWNSPDMNYTFDAIVYCVFVSLSFAAIENVMYVFQYGMEVAVIRGLITIPGHMCFAVFMGLFYGRAKYCEVRGNTSGKTRNLILSYVVPVILHSVFDGALMIGTEASTLFFYAFILALDAAVIYLIRHESKNDIAIY